MVNSFFNSVCPVSRFACWLLLLVLIAVFVVCSHVAVAFAAAAAVVTCIFYNLHTLQAFAYVWMIVSLARRPEMHRKALDLRIEK